MKNIFSIITADLNSTEHSRAFVRLVDEYVRGDTGKGSPLSAEIKNRLVPGIRQHKYACVYFAVAGIKIIGLAVCFKGYSTFSAAPLINIHDLIITKKYRRKGAASALIKHIESQAIAAGCCKITLEVRADNGAALALYKREGFGLGERPMFFMTKGVSLAVRSFRRDQFT